MARVYQREKTIFDPVLRPVETIRLSGVRRSGGQGDGLAANAVALLVFNFMGFVAVYAIQRLQAFLPLNPEGFPAVAPDSSFNTAVSFVSNTNWQGYGGRHDELSHADVALTVQNFLSAASGMAVLVLIIRGVSRHSVQTLGNFWVDMTRSVLYVLLPAVHDPCHCAGLPGSRSESVSVRAGATGSDIRYATGPHRGCSCFRWVRPRHRLRSSNWGRTAADSSMRIPLIRSRTRPRCRICWRCLRSSCLPPRCV